MTDAVNWDIRDAIAASILLAVIAVDAQAMNVAYGCLLTIIRIAKRQM